MRHRNLLYPLLAACLATGCTGGDDKSPADDTADSGTDTDTGGDTDSGDDTDTDTGGGGGFASLTDDDQFMMIMDIAASTDTIYAVGTDENGEAAIASIDAATGELRTLYFGDPLVLPSGVALSSDGTTLYIADPAADLTGDGLTNGGVFDFDLEDFEIGEVGVAGQVDMPTDVSITYGGNELYIAGFTTDGEPGIFSYIIDSGAVYTRTTGAPMVEPVQLDANADGTLLYVLDALGTGSRANVWAYITSTWTDTEAIYEGFNTSFPGGLSVDPGEDLAYISAYPGSLVAAATDGSGFEVVDTLDLLTMPTGVFALYDKVYVADAGDLGDLFVLSL